MDSTPGHPFLGCCIWLTGFPGSGKSTIAQALAKSLREGGHQKVAVLDGNDLRKDVCADLGFSKEDRDKNIDRVTALATFFARDHVVICAFVSPYRAARDDARRRIPRFSEVHVCCSIAECIRRDPKGEYAKAKAGEIKGFTGVDGPYEVPLSPDAVIYTEEEDPSCSAARIERHLLRRFGTHETARE